MTKVGGQNILIGLTSHKYGSTRGPCRLSCWPGDTTYFTRIAEYVYWMFYHMKYPKFCNSGSYASDAD